MQSTQRRQRSRRATLAHARGTLSPLSARVNRTPSATAAAAAAALLAAAAALLVVASVGVGARVDAVIVVGLAAELHLSAR